MGSSLLLLAAENTRQNLSIFDPASPGAGAIRDLSILVFAITGLIFVVVEGVLFYTIFRFRRAAARQEVELAPGVPGPGQPTPEPPQVYGSKPIEIAWTAAPALIVFILVLVTARTLWEVDRGDPPDPRETPNALYVTVVGRQWWWEYRYEYYDKQELGFTTANELHVPVDDANTERPVYLRLQSADVCHSFWVPRLAGKTDLIPGRTNHTWFHTAEPGLHLGQCAEYCGTQHANMLLRVVAESPEKFREWLDNERKPAVDDPNATEGKKVFLAQSCVNCHAVRGTTARGTYAPDLTHLMRRKTLASGMIENNPETLGRWLRDPQTIKQGCLMPAFGLTERETDLVLRYLLTLK